MHRCGPVPSHLTKEPKLGTVVLKHSVQRYSVLISILGWPNWDNTPRADLNQGNESAPEARSVAPDGWKCGPMKRSTLYFRLSLVWLAILVGSLSFLLFR